MIQILSKNCFTDISQFEIDKLKTIGKGSFGVVRLGIHKGTNKVYAIKIIDLNNIERDYELKLIQRQINLHSCLDHPHVIKLWDTILDKNMVYLIMEYAECGNLFHHQNTKYKFNEAEAFKFFYQILRSVDYMHSEDTIHRDIKPQNILLDKRNNALLADFGWSAKGISEQRSTFCGTYEYMAPEMIAKENYNYKVDIWSLGVLLYEMLHGNAPFSGETLPDVQRKIQKGQYEIYAGLSLEVKGLIRDILHFNPANRPNTKDILKHKWIKKMQVEINSIIKNQIIREPNDVTNIISKIVTENQKKQGKIKIMHKKTTSAMNMFETTKDKKIQIDFDMGSPEERNKKKRQKGLKQVTTESTKKLSSQRTQSPIFASKQNCNAAKSIGIAKQAKYNKAEHHSRLLTEINDKLKVGSYSHLRTNSKNFQDKKEAKKRSRLHQMIG